MLEERIVVREIYGDEVNILNAEQSKVKFNKTGIFICKKGEVTLTIDDREYNLHVHSLIVYFSYSTLHIISHSKDLEGILIGANLEMLQPVLYQVTNFNAIFIIKKMPLKQLGIELYDQFMKYIDLFVDANEKSKCKEEDVQQQAVAEIAKKQTELLGSCIVLNIVQCYTNMNLEVTHNSRKDEVLQKFVATLYRKYRTEHEVSYYAEQQYLTSRYFSAIVKEKSGKSPSQWISTALLVDAKKMLSDTNMSIKEVSDVLNFPNQSYFGKWFKNLTGVGPLGYRYGKVQNDNTDNDFADVIQRGIVYVNQ